MYYVSGKSIYLTSKDKDTGVYREVKLVRDDAGDVTFEVQPSGVSKKPVNRQICSAREVLAQLGSNAKARKTSAPELPEDKPKLRM